MTGVCFCNKSVRFKTHQGFRVAVGQSVLALGLTLAGHRKKVCFPLSYLSNSGLVFWHSEQGYNYNGRFRPGTSVHFCVFVGYSWSCGGTRGTKLKAATWALPGSPSGPVVGGGRFPIQAHDWLFKDHASSSFSVPHPPTAQDKPLRLVRPECLC